MLAWYKIEKDGDYVSNIEELKESYDGEDARGLGVSAFDEDDNETWADACQVAEFKPGYFIASFDKDVMSDVIEVFENGVDVEVTYVD